MVAAISATAAPNNANPSNPKTPFPHSHQADLQNPTRPPLIPSEKDNATVSRKPRTKEISSRYLSSHSSSSSNSTSSSSTTTTTTTTTTSSSSSSSRRFPSPLLTPRPAPTSTLPQPSAPKRSQSVDRTRPSTPRPSTPRPSTPRPDPNPAVAEISEASRALCTTTRSLSVSFQGESFFYQTSKAKSSTPNSARKPTPERRRTNATTPVRSGRSDADQAENCKPFDHHHRWPAARARQSNPMMRSLDCNLEKKEPILAAVRLLQHSMVFDEGRRASFDGGDLSASSDTDSVSSGSNSGMQEMSLPSRGRGTPRGISVPARFWQETNSRLRRLPEPGTPLSKLGSRTAPPPKLVPAKKSLIDGPLSSPRTVSSPHCGPVRPSSPSKVQSSPMRGMASPLRTRSSMLVSSSSIGQRGNAPSILSFAAEVRRSKKGENRIEEAHLLRLFHNRHLQWRCVNARANAALLVQRLTSEKNLYSAWITTSEMRDSVTIKRIKLQLLTQNIKLTSILKGQMTYLEEWSLRDRDHSSSLSGAIEALKASTLRLPVVGGAKADIQEVKDAVGSAVDVMQAMGSSICSLLSKVEGAGSLVSELAKVAAQERAMLNQSRDLLSTVAAMHVKQCSLRGHILQLKRNPSPVQL